MTEAPTRRFRSISLNPFRYINDCRPRPNMHSAPHHLLRDPVQTTRLDTHSRSRFALLRDRLVHQPGATSSTEETSSLAVAVGSGVGSDCAGIGRGYGEGGEDGGHAVGGGALVAAFGAVADEELEGGGERGGEGYEAALAASFHCFWIVSSSLCVLISLTNGECCVDDRLNHLIDDCCSWELPRQSLMFVLQAQYSTSLCYPFKLRPRLFVAND